MSFASVSRRPARGALLALISVALAGCGGGTDAQEGEAVLLRLIPPDGPTLDSDLRRDLALAPVWQAPIDAPADLQAWSFYVPSAPAVRAAGGGIDLGALRDSVYLVWNGRLESAGIDAMRLRFQRPLGGQVELYWNGEGEDFAPQRYALQSPDPVDPHQVLFDLSDMRQWRSPITRIGIRLLEPAAAGQALVRAEGLRYLAKEGMGNGETRYVTLDGRSMQAWLSRPGSTIRRPLEVPPGALLRFHVASLLAAGDGANFRVAVEGRHGRRVLVEGVLPQPSNPPRWRWKAFEADLQEFAGTSVELSFETAPAAPGSLVLWGNPLLVGPGTAGAQRPNVVLISLDTVRADHLSVYGYPRATSPALAAWAGRWATVFETAVASAPWTLPSHVSMLSGIDAVHHGVNRHGPIASAPALLPERLRDAGYATYATTAGVLLTPELGFARGFDEFHVRGKMVSLPEWSAEMERGVADALRFLGRNPEQRFFLFFHTYEAHTPYQPREPYFSEFGGDSEGLNAGLPVWTENDGYESGVRPRQRAFHPATQSQGVAYPKRVLEPADRELATALYDSGLAHIDSELGRLLRYLEVEGLMENTVVVVTSDHGEALFEHGLVGHSSLYDHDLLVPLLIAAPGPGSRGRRVADQVRSVDIAPTLIELAGLPPLGRIDGKSLLRLMKGETMPPLDAWSYALSTTRGVSLRTARGPRKLIAQDTVFDPFRGGFEEFDLLRDPAELHPFADAMAPQQRQRLVREVTATASAIQLTLANGGSTELTGRLRGSVIDSMVTSADLGFSCCATTDTGIPLRVPPGALFTMVLPDRAAGGSLGLRLTVDGQSWLGSVLPAENSTRLRVAFEDGRWQASDATGQPAIGVQIQLPVRREAPSTNDEELRAKLRALGYIR